MLHTCSIIFKTLNSVMEECRVTSIGEVDSSYPREKAEASTLWSEVSLNGPSEETGLFYFRPLERVFWVL